MNTTTNTDRLTHNAKVYCAVRKIKLLEQSVDILRQAHVADVNDRQVADLYVGAREALDRAEREFYDLRSKNTEIIIDDVKAEISGMTREEAEDHVAQVIAEHEEKDDTYIVTLRRDLEDLVWKFAREGRFHQSA